MSLIANLPSLPPDTQPVVDESGIMAIAWRNYFRQLDDRMRKLIMLYGAGPSAVSALPSAATAGAGARAFVTDATSTTFHATVAGGGSNKVPVVSDGANWLIG